MLPWSAVTRDPAVEEALGLISRKPRTVAELRETLSGQDYPPAAVEDAVAYLVDRGWLDDLKLATDFIVLRARRLGHGPRRLLGDLRRRGVDRDVAQTAWDQAVSQGEIELRSLTQRALRRRLPAEAGPTEPRLFARVYNAMLRSGFDASDVDKEMEPYRPIPDDT